MATKKAVKVIKRGSTTTNEPRQVTVLVNSQVVGTIPDTVTIGQAIEIVGTTHGIRTGMVKINGKKISLPDANKPMKGVKTFELYAKDSRG